MNEYIIQPSAKANVDALVQTLVTLQIPYSDILEEKTRVVRIGSDADYEIRSKSSRFHGMKTTLCLRYEHPVIKKLLADWLDKCGASAEDRFYKWHASLSPSVLSGIKARWKVDLSGMATTPVVIGQVVLVFMFDKNVTAQLSEQLKQVPHKRMAADEFIECTDFVVKGDDPFNTIVYMWRTDAGSQLFAVTASAPAMTMLSLWVIANGTSAKHNINELPAS